MTDKESKIDAFDPDTWTEDEEYYFRTVDRFWRERAEEPFSNGRPLHAVYLLHKFFTSARHDVRIFSGSLLRHVRKGEVDEGMSIYSDCNVLKAIKDFLSKDGTCLNIVVDEDVDVDDGEGIADHPLVQTVKALEIEGLRKGNCEIRRANPAQIKEMRDNEFYCHMLVMDDSAYRLEIDPKRATAYVNVNDKTRAAGLAGFFDKMLYEEGSKLWSTEPAPVT